jgi:hypothetical protein
MIRRVHIPEMAGLCQPIPRFRLSWLKKNGFRPKSTAIPLPRVQAIMNFNNIRVGTKLWLAVGFLVLSLVALIGFAAVRSTQSQAKADAALTRAERLLTLSVRWSGLT